jgi:hypothetical protein
MFLGFHNPSVIPTFLFFRHCMYSFVFLRMIMKAQKEVLLKEPIYFKKALFVPKRMKCKNNIIIYYCTNNTLYLLYQQ